MNRNKVNVLIQGQMLDLFEDTAIVFKRKIKDAQDISKLFTDFTHDFEIPSSKTNDRIFKHAFRRDSSSFDTRGYYSASVEVNGDDYSQGYINLMGSTFKSGKTHTYKIRYFGKLLVLSRILGDTTLSDIRGVFSKYNFPQADETKYDLLTTSQDVVLDTSGVEWANYSNEQKALVSGNVRVFLNTDGERGLKFNTKASFESGDFTDNETNTAYTTWTTNTTVDDFNGGRGVANNGFNISRAKASLREPRVLDGIEEYFKSSGLQFSRGLDANGFPTSDITKVVAGEEHFFGSEEFMNAWILFYNKNVGGGIGQRTLYFEDDWDPGDLADLPKGLDRYCDFGPDGFDKVYAPVSPYKINNDKYSDYYLELDLTSSVLATPWELIIKLDGEEIKKYKQSGNLQVNNVNELVADNTINVKGFRLIVGEQNRTTCGLLSFEVKSNDPLSISGQITLNKVWKRKGGIVETFLSKDLFQFSTFSNTISDSDSDSANYTLEANTPNMKITEYLRGFHAGYNVLFSIEKDANNRDIVVGKDYDSFYEIDGDPVDLTQYVDTQDYEGKSPAYYTEIEFEYEKGSTFQTREFDNTQPVAYGALKSDVRLDNDFLSPSKPYKVKNPFELILLNNPTNENTVVDTTMFTYAWLVDNSYQATETKMFRHYGVNEGVGSGNVGLLIKDRENVAYDEVLTCNLISKFRYTGTEIDQTLLYSTNTEDERKLSGADLTTPSLYNTYWKKSIEETLDKQAKQYSFPARLPKNIINNLGLEKTVLISDNPYRINGYEVDVMSGRANLDLISLNDPRISTSYREQYEAGFIRNSITINSFLASTNLGIFEGTATTLTVDASGADDLTYTWFKNGTVITGETGTTYSFTPVDNDAIYVRVTDGSYETDTRTLTFSVYSAALTLSTIAVSNSTPAIAGEDVTVTITGAENVPYTLTIADIDVGGWIDVSDFDAATGVIPAAGTIDVTLSIPGLITFNGGSFKVVATNSNIQSNALTTGTITQGDGTFTISDTDIPFDGETVTLTIVGPVSKEFYLDFSDLSPAGSISINSFVGGNTGTTDATGNATKMLTFQENMAGLNITGKVRLVNAVAEGDFLETASFTQVTITFLVDEDGNFITVGLDDQIIF